MIKRIKDPGFGETTSQTATSMMHEDGSFNISYKNKPRSFQDTYHFLINLSNFSFLLIALSSFIVVNTIFACLYLVVGIEQITLPQNNVFLDFANAFFFSSQTLTTLGYGAMSPTGFASGLISSFEAFVGLSMFSFLTGLIYGRFSKPKASVRFSKHIVLRDFNNTRALMFRLVNNRTSIMIKPKIAVTLALTKKNNVGNFVRSFYNLKLERDEITYLPTTWTVVHEIDEDSPLFSLPKQEVDDQNGELLIMLSYFDDSFNQEVHQMHSYTLKQTKIDYKFGRSYYYDTSGQMVLDYNKFDNIEPA